MARTNPDINQLDEDDRAYIGKYAFSIANGNHILRYTEQEYRPYLSQHPKALSQLFIYAFASDNWGYEDNRYFEDYDEQWLSQQVDSTFNCTLDFNDKAFDYHKLLPYQKLVIDFTQDLLKQVSDLDTLLHQGSQLEMIYAVVANNIDLDSFTGDVLNKAQAISRGLDMYHYIMHNKSPLQPFEQWETVLF